jgi:hypothetical protein
MVASLDSMRVVHWVHQLAEDSVAVMAAHWDVRTDDLTAFHLVGSKEHGKVEWMACSWVATMAVCWVA